MCFEGAQTCVRIPPIPSYIKYFYTNVNTLSTTGNYSYLRKSPIYASDSDKQVNVVDI